MFVEKDGIRIEIINERDAQKFLKIGYVKVEEEKETKAKAKK